MRVGMKDFNVEMEIKNRGIELDVYTNNNRHLGDLVITKTQLIWCPGRTTSAKGKRINWEDFIQYMNSR